MAAEVLGRHFVFNTNVKAVALGGIFCYPYRRLNRLKSNNQTKVRLYTRKSYPFVLLRLL